MVQNRTTKRVLINAVGGGIVGRAGSSKGGGGYVEPIELANEGGISEREVEGVVVMLGTNDLDNGLKRG